MDISPFLLLSKILPEIRSFLIHVKGRGIMRKTINGKTMSELKNRLNDNLERNWVQISEILEINGRFEVLMEHKGKSDTNG